MSAAELQYTSLATALFLCISLVVMAKFGVVLGKIGYSPTWGRVIAAFSVGLLGRQLVLNDVGQSVERAGALTS